MTRQFGGVLKVQQEVKSQDGTVVKTMVTLLQKENFQIGIKLYKDILYNSL